MIHARAGAWWASLLLVLSVGGLLPSSLCRAGADEPAPPPAPSPAPAPAPAPKPEPPVLAEDLPVPDLLRSLSRITGVAVTWSEQDKAVMNRKVLQGGAVLRSSPETLLDAVRALLANDEIVLVPYGPATDRSYRAMDARMLQSQFISKMQPDVVEVTDEMVPTLLGQGGRFVAATLRVRHLADLRDARNALQRLITQNNVGSLTEVPAARAFLVTDFAPNVAAVYRVLRQMDVPVAPPPSSDASRVAPAYFVLKHARAQATAILLDRLFPARAAAPTGGVPRQAQDGTAPAAPGAPPPRISYDDATNQIVVIATAEDTATIRDIVRNVDVEAAK